MNILTSELVFHVFAALALITAVLVVVKANPVGSAVCLALCFLSAAAIMFQLDAPFLGVIQILVYTGAIMVLILFVVMLLNLKDEKKAVARPLPVIAGVVIAGAFMFQLWGVVYSIPGADEASDVCDIAQLQTAFTAPKLDTSVSGRQPVKPEIVDVNITEVALQSSDLQTSNGANRIIDEKIEQITQPSDAQAEHVPMEPALYFNEAYPLPGQSPLMQLPQIIPAEFSYPDKSTIGQNASQGEFPDTALLGYRLFAKFNKELVILSLALLASAIGSVVLTRRPENN